MASWLEKFVGRARYGQLTQEVLDRIARTGLYIYPYQLVHERPIIEPQSGQETTRFEMRLLDPTEVDAVLSIRERPVDAERLKKRFQHGGCFGVWDGDSLAAYSWYSTKRVPVTAGGSRLCSLPAGYLYLYDAYVMRDYRGFRLAGLMRYRLYQALRETGATDFVSISLTFNRSTRRFKARLGAVEVEHRLQLSTRALGGIDIRLRKRAPHDLDTQRFLRIPRRRTVESQER